MGQQARQELRLVFEPRFRQADRLLANPRLGIGHAQGDCFLVERSEQFERPERMQTAKGAGAIEHHRSQRAHHGTILAFEQKPLGCLAPPGIRIGQVRHQVARGASLSLGLRRSRAPE